MPLSPLSKHLLLQHEYDSDSLDDDVTRHRSSGRRRHDVREQSREPEVYEVPASESPRAPQRSRHRDITPRKRKRRRDDPVLEISSAEEGGKGEEGSEGEMEILELEMSARAIKAMLKAQEQLDRVEDLRKQRKQQRSDHSTPSKKSSSASTSREAGGGARKERVVTKDGKTKVVVRKLVRKKRAQIEKVTSTT